MPRRPPPPPPGPPNLGPGVQPETEDHIQCLECGRWFRALGAHLLWKHELDVDSYKAAHELLASRSLVAPSLRETFAERERARLAADPDYFDRHLRSTPEELAELRQRSRERVQEVKHRAAYRANGRRLTAHASQVRAEQIQARYDELARGLGYPDAAAMLHATVEETARDLAARLGVDEAGVVALRGRHGVRFRGRQAQAEARRAARAAALRPPDDVPHGVQPEDEQGRLQCLECSRCYARLAPHLQRVHGLDTKAYRAAHGLHGVRLESAELQERNRARSAAAMRDNPAIRAALRAHHARRGAPVWEAGLAAAREFHAARGHLEPEPGDTVGGIDLHRWVTRQRAAGQSNKLSSEQVAALDSLGLDWRRRVDRWERGLAAARAFHARHGHLEPGPRAQIDGFPVGAWVAERRRDRRRGRLPAERIAALDALGIAWNPGPPRTVPVGREWETGHEALVAFVTRTGHADVHARHREGDVALGRWLIARRGEHRHGRLAVEKVAALTALGVRWEPDAERLDAALAACRAFHSAHGHLQPPTTLRIDDGRHLGTWLANQRRARRDGELDPAVEAALDALGMDWDPPLGVRAGDLRFSDVLVELEAFHAEHGHVNVPPSHRGSVVPDVARWVAYLRKRHAKGQLPAEQVAVLERLGIDWDPYATRRRDWLRLCAEYRARHGDLDVPYDHGTACGRKLGAWLSQQRGRRRQGLLDPDVAAGLQALGVVWDPPATPRTLRRKGG